ncbi:MAG: hypothetical protein QXL67_03505 [Candidatus Bathyarchaeia archaeon]
MLQKAPYNLTRFNRLKIVFRVLRDAFYAMDFAVKLEVEMGFLSACKS